MGGGGEAQTEPFGSKRKTQRDEGWKIVSGRGEKEMSVGSGIYKGRIWKLAPPVIDGWLTSFPKVFTSWCPGKSECN